jgi:hypothetical protein
LKLNRENRIHPSGFIGQAAFFHPGDTGDRFSSSPLPPWFTFWALLYSRTLARCSPAPYLHRDLKRALKHILLDHGVYRGVGDAPVPRQSSQRRYVVSITMWKSWTRHSKRLILISYLDHLPVTKEEVNAHFATHGTGEITEIKLMNGFGFIEYKDPMDARDVVPGMYPQP